MSIIVPTLNEELILKKTLMQIQQLSPHELIVSDGGSTDNTTPIAQKFSHRVVTGSTGRAMQMNAGADQATGDLLLFLHADNRLEPKGYQKCWSAWKTLNGLEVPLLFASNPISGR